MSVSRPAGANSAVVVGARHWLHSTRTFLLLTLVFGLAFSISVSQITLGVLAVWVLLARWTGRGVALRLPLLGPVAVFAACSVVAALASARPGESLASCKGLLDLAALFVIASAAMLGSVLWNTPWASSIWGFAVIAAGLPIYWWMRRGLRAR